MNRQGGVWGVQLKLGSIYLEGLPGTCGVSCDDMQLRGKIGPGSSHPAVRGKAPLPALGPLLPLLLPDLSQNHLLHHRSHPFPPHLLAALKVSCSAKVLWGLFNLRPYGRCLARNETCSWLKELPSQNVGEKTSRALVGRRKAIKEGFT